LGQRVYRGDNLPFGTGPSQRSPHWVKKKKKKVSQRRGKKKKSAKGRIKYPFLTVAKSQKKKKMGTSSLRRPSEKCVVGKGGRKASQGPHCRGDSGEGSKEERKNFGGRMGLGPTGKTAGWVSNGVKKSFARHPPKGPPGQKKKNPGGEIIVRNTKKWGLQNTKKQAKNLGS